MEGDISEETVTLSFSVAEMANGDVYRIADSETASAKTNTWYESVYTGGDLLKASKEKYKHQEIFYISLCGMLV